MSVESTTVKALMLASHLALTVLALCGMLLARGAVSFAVWLLLVMLLLAGAVAAWFQRIGRLAPAPPPLIVAGLVLSVVVPGVLIGSLSVVLQAGVMQALAALVAVKVWALRRSRDEREWQTAAAILLVYGALVGAETLLEAQVLLSVGLLVWIVSATCATLVAWFRQSTTIVSLNDEVEDLVPVVSRVGMLLAFTVVLAWLLGIGMLQLRRATPFMIPARVWHAVEKNLVDYYSHFSPIAIQERNQVERLTTEEARLEEELRALERSTAKEGTSGHYFAQMVPQRVAERTAWLGPVQPPEQQVEEQESERADEAQTPEAPVLQESQPEEVLAEPVVKEQMESVETLDEAGSFTEQIEEESLEIAGAEFEPSMPVTPGGRRWWRWLLALLVVGAAVASRWIPFMRRRLAAQRDARQHIVWLYQETLRIGAWCGCAKPVSATPTEYAALVQDQRADLRESIMALTDLFHEARFSTHPMMATHVARALATARQLWQRWRSGVPWWRRGLALLASIG